MQASRIIKQFDEVKMVVGKTGAAEVPTDPMPPEATDMMIFLNLKKNGKSDKSYDELADEINEKLEAIPGVFFEKNQPIQMRFNELMTGIRQDVAVKIFGENMDTFTYADKVVKDYTNSRRCYISTCRTCRWITTNKYRIRQNTFSQLWFKYRRCKRYCKYCICRKKYRCSL
jgi:multidrug efflux pump subunit AcrB